MIPTHISLDMSSPSNFAIAGPAGGGTQEACGHEGQRHHLPTLCEHKPVGFEILFLHVPNSGCEMPSSRDEASPSESQGWDTSYCCHNHFELS